MSDLMDRLNAEFARKFWAGEKPDNWPDAVQFPVIFHESVDTPILPPARRLHVVRDEGDE